MSIAALTQNAMPETNATVLTYGKVNASYNTADGGDDKHCSIIVRLRVIYKAFVLMKIYKTFARSHRGDIVSACFMMIRDVDHLVNKQSESAEDEKIM